MPEGSGLLRRALVRMNLEVKRRHHAPFGVRWHDDVGFYLQGRPLGVAFDVGAHRGETALKLLSAFPGVEVHSFEPLPENFAALAEATVGRGVRTVNAAVSDRSGTARIARGEASYQTSVHGSGEKLDVPAVTVDEYARERGVGRIDLLKIDTEGHEEAVLRGAMGQLEQGTVEFVVCECEFTPRPEEPHADFRAVQDLLGPLGYRVVSFYTGGVDNIGWIWGDVLFRHAPGERDRSSGSLSPHTERRILGFW
jgi:FkbM family methyltransferase